MVKLRSLLLSLLLISSGNVVFADEKKVESATNNSLLVTVAVALIGYFGKSLYELYLDQRKKKIQNMEDKLKFFYWPILMRLEKDNTIWETILSKREVKDSFQYRVADKIEKEIVLTNHQEILDIINSYVYLAEPDAKMTDIINRYIKNVVLYKALRDANDETKFPIDLGAPWPDEFYPLMQQKTAEFQDKLNRIKI